LAADADESLRYRDPDLAPAKDTNEIDTAAMQRVLEAPNVLRMNDPDKLGDWFGRFITTYRNAGDVQAAQDGGQGSRIEIEWDLTQGGSLQRHPWSRMAWRRARKGARLYCNGNEFALPARDASRIAAASELTGSAYAALSESSRDVVFELLVQGHYQLSLPETAP
ncbi:MAG: winged helix domain-containing protein, partial [Luteimonas sp.]